MPRVSQEWMGPEFIVRVNRAAGRAIVGIGMQVAVDTKRVTDVLEGNLRRSIHIAPKSADHSGDENAAGTTDLLANSMNVEAEHSPEGPSIEVGSWLDYACVEWIGRGHPGIQQGLESVRGARATSIVLQAFREERL